MWCRWYIYLYIVSESTTLYREWVIFEDALQSQPP
jgi:hypothetical protein